jgi:hypothetical protein
MANTSLQLSKLRSAQLAYRSEWSLVDQVIESAFANHQSNLNYGGVYLKVVLVERLYSAGIKRCKLTEPEVAKALMSMGDRLTSISVRLQRLGLTRQTLPRIIQIHGIVTSRLQKATGPNSKYLYSFVSKYLYFSTGVFPIYDTQAEGGAKGLVSRQLLQSTCRAMRQLEGGMDNYRKHATRFLLVHEDALALDPLATPKETDFLLWD